MKKITMMLAVVLSLTFSASAFAANRSGYMANYKDTRNHNVYSQRYDNHRHDKIIIVKEVRHQPKKAVAVKKHANPKPLSDTSAALVGVGLVALIAAAVIN
ncbi:hypothetical protein [Endomicrobium proavitum]|uniref:Uncharacterized protein n=1 Tax=Endomicrobium proavitum TaxID=1408281 RepID=A0A0G3WJC1_9BACT|nr:hypothetical protein [Endomicrobium proavitum]AKL98443.1 exported protein of unknown function [Endomicrobium proavitum]